MNHAVDAIFINNCPPFLRTKGQNFHACLAKGDKVFVFIQQKASALTFPKLEAFVSEDHKLFIVNCDVHANNIVSVNVNSLETNDQLFQPSFTSQNEHICVSNIQLIFPFNQEMNLVRVIFVHFNNEESEFFVKFVCKYKELVAFRVVNDFLNRLQL